MTTTNRELDVVLLAYGGQHRQVEVGAVQSHVRLTLPRRQVCMYTAAGQRSHQSQTHSSCVTSSSVISRRPPHRTEHATSSPAAIITRRNLQRKKTRQVIARCEPTLINYRRICRGATASPGITCDGCCSRFFYRPDAFPVAQ